MSAAKDLGDGYAIVGYTPAFKDEIAVLQKRLWSPDPILNRAYFEWKYEDNPFNSEFNPEFNRARNARSDQTPKARGPRLHVAVHDGKVVAMRGLAASAWEIGGADSPVSIYCADDLVVDAAHENRGLFARLTDAALADLHEDGHPYVLSTSALRVTRLQSLASGWRSIGSIVPLGRIRQDTALVARLRDAMRRLPLVWKLADRQVGVGPARRLFRRLDRVARRHPSMEIQSAPRSEAMADLVGRMGHDGRIRHVRDVRYFGWRYRNPMHEYRFLFAGESQLEGYLVLQRYRSSYGNSLRVNIVDCEAESAEVKRRLIEALISLANPPEMASWCNSFDPLDQQALAGMGFASIDPHLTSRGLPSILIRSVSTPNPTWRLGARSLLEIGDWDLRMAYSSLA